MRAATRDPVIVESGGAFHEVYPRLLEAILSSGRQVAPRGQATYEVSPMVFTLENPRDSIRLQKARRINYAYAIIEKLSLLHGVADPETFCFYIPALRKLLNEDGVFGGAYGPRVTEQLDFVYDLLVEDPETRRAVITVYSAREDPLPRARHPMHPESAVPLTRRIAEPTGQHALQRCLPRPALRRAAIHVSSATNGPLALR